MSATGQGRDPDDVPHDAMLRAALRHAPDREAAPPEAVRRAILTAAHQAVAPRRRARLTEALAALMATLRQPAAGAAFASLMLGTLVVLMWQDGPPPAPERHAERQRQQPPAAAVEAASGPVPAAPRARAEQPLAKQSATPTPPAPTPARRRTPVGTADRAAAPPDESRALAAAAPSASPATAAAPAPAAMPPVLGDASANASANAGAAAPAGPPVVASQRMADAAPPDPDPLAPVLAALATSRTEVAALERRATAPPPRAAAAKTAEEEPLRAAGDPSAWLRELRASARGRWQRVDAPALPDAHPLRAPDGALLGRVAIEGDAVLWLPADASGQAWRATLPPEALARLRAALSAP